MEVHPVPNETSFWKKVYNEFISGNASFCTIDQYFNCVIPNWGKRQNLFRFVVDLLMAEIKSRNFDNLQIITGVSNDTVTTQVEDLCARCPDACNSKAFDIEMSFATLSSLSVQELLSNKERSARLTKQFKVSKKCKKKKFLINGNYTLHSPRDTIPQIITFHFMTFQAKNKMLGCNISLHDISRFKLL